MSICLETDIVIILYFENVNNVVSEKKVRLDDRILLKYYVFSCINVILYIYWCFFIFRTRNFAEKTPWSKYRRTHLTTGLVLFHAVSAIPPLSTQPYFLKVVGSGHWANTNEPWHHMESGHLK